MNDADEDLKVAFATLERALTRLGDVLQRDAATDSALLDATIQRFEFSFELTWKTLKKVLFVAEGIDTASPKQTLQKAFSLGWIANEALWLDMLRARNLTSHTYQEALAWDIYRRIADFHAEMLRLQALLRTTYGTP